MNGFAFLNEGNYGTPIYWKNESGKWIGNVTLIKSGIAPTLPGEIIDIDIIDLEVRNCPNLTGRDNRY